MNFIKIKNKLKTFSVVIFVSILYCAILGMIFNNISSVPVISTEIDDTVHLPIIMYHSVNTDETKSGMYVITPETLRNDIAYLYENGYTFISAQELIDYTENNGELPEKPAMLTFDDGFYNIYGNVKPILEEYGAKAVVSIVGSYTDEFSQSNIANLNYGYLRWSDVYDMFLSKHIEIGNHSYDFHSTDNGRMGAGRNEGEDIDTYKQIFYDDTKKLQDRCMEKTGFSPVIYTYPFGEYDKESTEVLKNMGFKMSFSCTEGINHITQTPGSLFLLKRYNRPSGISTWEFFKDIIE
ncbi:MAG: polysaccharide deacetylase family protein [Oscillospiraceae bacterium]|nr:polysaccharide deacetylase family protein [Oscillospiraceae bacterium]